jgi:hypothetical protein
MSTIAHALVSPLYMAFAMGWEILWPLILGFALSGVIANRARSIAWPTASDQIFASVRRSPKTDARRQLGIRYRTAFSIAATRAAQLSSSSSSFASFRSAVSTASARAA